MPQNIPDNLRTLLRLRTPSSFAAPIDDPYLARRTSEIYGGLDDLVPDADSAEVRAVQRETGGSVSRDAIRSSGMSNLRRILALGREKFGQERELAEVKGTYDVAGQQAGQAAAMDRLIATQRAIGERSEAGIQSREQLSRESMEAAAERAAEAIAGRRDVEELRQNEMNRRAESRGGSSWSALLRYLFGNPDADTPVEQDAVQPQAPARRRPRLLGVE